MRSPPSEKFPFSASISPLFPPPFGALVPFLSGPKAGRTSPQKKKKKSPLSLIENSVWLSGTKASLCRGEGGRAGRRRRLNSIYDE